MVMDRRLYYLAIGHLANLTATTMAAVNETDEVDQSLRLQARQGRVMLAFEVS